MNPATKGAGELDRIREIDRETVARYSERYAVHGVSHETLGWGSREQQAYRFDRVLDCADFAGRTVLDVGCGFGDLLAHLQQGKIEIAGYLGIDVNPDLIGEAKQRFPDASFECLGLMELAEDRFASDLVVMLGLLNFRQTRMENPFYAKTMLTKAYDICREACVADFLSDQVVEDYPKEDFVYYYDPCRVLADALELSAHVSLKHDYHPIPQREMMLTVRRAPCA